MILPPGLTKQDFQDALAEFGEAVGSDWVFASDDMLETYRDAYSLDWGTDSEPLASAAIAPASGPDDAAESSCQDLRRGGPASRGVRTVPPGRLGR